MRAISWARPGHLSARALFRRLKERTRNWNGDELITQTWSMIVPTPPECTWWTTNRPALRRASVRIFHYAATRFFCDALGFSDIAGKCPAYGHVHHLHVVERGALSIGQSVSGVN